MSSANGVITSPKLSFGWRTNPNADGFEQDHGRFTIEVYWDAKKRVWGINVWGNVVVQNNRSEYRVLREGSDPDLNLAKKIGLRFATVLEKEALSRKG